MLTALCDEVRVYAGNAAKGLDYICPGCRRSLILRKGAVRIHHFAHRPPVTCLWGIGETAAHLAAKELMREVFLGRSLVAEAEWPIASLAGDRRADVYVEDMVAGKLAIELQHTPISREAIAARTRSYLAAGIAVFWVAFLGQALRLRARRPPPDEDGDWLIERYVPRPFERWIAGYCAGDIWYYAPRTGKLFRGRLEQSAGIGGEESVWDAAIPAEPLPRWRTLRLWGPVDPWSISFRRIMRKETASGSVVYPAGPIVRCANIR